MCRHIHSVSHTYASARDMLQIFQRGDLSTSAALIRQMKMIDAADANSHSVHVRAEPSMEMVHAAMHNGSLQQATALWSDSDCAFAKRQE